MLSDETRLKHRKSFIGRTQRVLVQSILENGYARGFGEHYIPIIIEKKELNTNNFYDVDIVAINEIDEPTLIGKVRN